MKQTAIKQRPILFSTAMVQAILEGRKTMTRRIIKSKHESGLFQVCTAQMDINLPCYYHRKSIQSLDWDERTVDGGDILCPYGKVGDVLWVRENYYQYGKWVNNGLTKTGKQKRKFVPLEEEVLFSDTEEVLGETFHLEMGDRSTGIPGWFKRLGRFMPKGYARTFLRITDIRIERLQDISEADSIAEGVQPVPSFDSGYGISNRQFYRNYLPVGYAEVLPIDSFHSLWESINGAGSWSNNPFVWVVNFEKIDNGGKYA